MLAFFAVTMGVEPATLRIGECSFKQEKPGTLQSSCSIAGIGSELDEMRKDIRMLKNALGIATPPAPPDPPMPPYVGPPSMPPQTPAFQQIFTYTGAAQMYTVPAGVTTLSVKAWGAAGGGCNFDQNSAYTMTIEGKTVYHRGGFGTYVQCGLVVTPGQMLTVIVGQVHARFARLHV